MACNSTFGLSPPFAMAAPGPAVAAKQPVLLNESFKACFCTLGKESCKDFCHRFSYIFIYFQWFLDVFTRVSMAFHGFQSICIKDLKGEILRRRLAPGARAVRREACADASGGPLPQLEQRHEIQPGLGRSAKNSLE